MSDPRSLGRDIGEQLDGVADGGTARAGDAEVDVAEVDRLGVRITGVRVKRPEGQDVAEVAQRLPHRLRSLPEPVEPIEVDPGLGRAILRTSPDEVRDREFFEIDVTEREIELKRLRSGEDGRESVDWTMTRRQLERLIDEIDE